MRPGNFIQHPTRPELAIFIQRTEDGTHTGILHVTNGYVVKVHVGWHYFFESRFSSFSGAYVVPILLQEEIEDVLGICRLIHDRQTGPYVEQRYLIPYAFDLAEGTYFDADSGDLLLGGSLGFTCATFVLNVFEKANVPLVQRETWVERADDNARHLLLLEKLKNGIPEYQIPPASKEHTYRVPERLPCIRVRPEEVAAAGLFPTLPIPFADAAPAGEWVLRNLPQNK